MKKTLIALFALVQINSCTTQYTGYNLILSSGGGFSGRYEQYAVNGRGEVRKIDSRTGDETLLDKLPAGQCSRLFKKAVELGLISVSFEGTGNMTYSITLSDGTKSNLIQWGKPGSTPPQFVSDFFDETWEMLRNKKAAQQ